MRNSNSMKRPILLLLTAFFVIILSSPVLSAYYYDNTTFFSTQNGDDGTQCEGWSFNFSETKYLTGFSSDGESYTRVSLYNGTQTGSHTLCPYSPWNTSYKDANDNYMFGNVTINAGETWTVLVSRESPQRMWYKASVFPTFGNTSIPYYIIGQNYGGSTDAYMRSLNGIFFEDVPAPVSDPYAYVKVFDQYNNSTISGLTVYLGTQTNTTDGSGIAYFYNNDGLNYTVDGGTNYFNISGTATANSTTEAYTYGAFVTINLTDITGASIDTFNASSGDSVNTTTTGTLQLVLEPDATNSVVINASGYVYETRDITTTGKDTNTYNLTGFYQTLVTINATYVFNSTPINNFTINYTGLTNGSANTTNGTVQFPAMEGEYNFFIDAPTYAYDNITTNTTTPTFNYTFSLYTTNSIYFSFYDVDTGLLINYTNITVEIDGGLGIYQTSNGTLYIDLITPNTYNMAYAALGYVNNFYIFTINDRSTQAINLTMLNQSNSGEVTLYVYDKLGRRIEGAVIKILRYDSINNTFSTVSTLQTNIEGLVETSLTKDTQYYKFIIDYENETRYTSVPTYIYGTTLSFYIDIYAETLVSTFDMGQISGSIYYNNATETATFTFSDVENVATQGCIKAYDTDLNLINSSCVSSSSGTVYTITYNTTASWYLVGEVTKGGTTYIIDTYRKDYGTTLPDTGGLGLFLGFIIFCVVIFIGIWSLEIAVMLGGVTPLLLTVMGVTSLGYVFTVPVFILSVIAAFIIGGTK